MYNIHIIHIKRFFFNVNITWKMDPSEREENEKLSTGECQKARERL